MIEMLFTGCSLLKLAHDGLEREFRVFNWLGCLVCATRAPGDQEKSCDSQGGALSEADGAAFSGAGATQDFESYGRLCEADEQPQFSKMKIVTQSPRNRVGVLIHPRSNRS
ncbi:hypothetical protein [Bradyrhizobium sp. CCGUVB23]|uniref:hypothetical protein n=1 Tax=Bradyrhizobium sp. CCGUVB23 TaxID=2949630 RepID=UPI0020B2381F|nr:hypothetical protein [Bradyrhizobium sp. CCGUVB23]MCP3467301.1 hypothetical protein [Bradyrhizobium sp. CCGUVB23]